MLWKSSGQGTCMWMSVGLGVGGNRFLWGLLFGVWRTNASVLLFLVYVGQKSNADSLSYLSNLQVWWKSEEWRKWNFSSRMNSWVWFLELINYLLDQVISGTKEIIFRQCSQWGMSLTVCNKPFCCNFVFFTEILNRFPIPSGIPDCLKKFTEKGSCSSISDKSCKPVKRL